MVNLNWLSKAGALQILLYSFWMPSRIKVMDKLSGMATIGFSINIIDSIIKPRELAVKATAKKAINKANNGTIQMNTYFQSVMEEIFGINSSLMRDCL